MPEVLSLLFVSKARAELLLSRGVREAENINDLCYLSYAWMLKAGPVAVRRTMDERGYPYSPFLGLAPHMYEGDVRVAMQLAWEVYVQTKVISWAKKGGKK